MQHPYTKKKYVRKARGLSVAIRRVIQNITHLLLALVPGILSPDSIPPPLLRQKDRARVSERAFSSIQFLWKKKKSFFFRSWTTGEIIIQNYDALISHLFKSNFSDYTSSLRSLSVLQKLIWHCQVMDYSLYILAKPTPVHHRLQGANCAVKMWLWLVPSFCHLIYGDLRSNLPLKLGF